MLVINGVHSSGRKSSFVFSLVPVVYVDRDAKLESRIADRLEGLIIFPSTAHGKRKGPVDSQRQPWQNEIKRGTYCLTNGNCRVGK